MESNSLNRSSSRAGDESSRQGEDARQRKRRNRNISTNAENGSDTVSMSAGTSSYGTAALHSVSVSRSSQDEGLSQLPGGLSPAVSSFLAPSSRSQGGGDATSTAVPSTFRISQSMDTSSASSRALPTELNLNQTSAATMAGTAGLGGLSAPDLLHMLALLQQASGSSTTNLQPPQASQNQPWNQQPSLGGLVSLISGAGNMSSPPLFAPAGASGLSSSAPVSNSPQQQHPASAANNLLSLLQQQLQHQQPPMAAAPAVSSGTETGNHSTSVGSGDVDDMAGPSSSSAGPMPAAPEESPRSNKKRKRTLPMTDRSGAPKKDSKKKKKMKSPKAAPAAGAGAGNPFLLPCRARGMPPDHNFRNAHFVIPPDVQHGEELICSYEACRLGGIKFRYCEICSLPVAKRNFNQRHSHGRKHVATIHSTWAANMETPAVTAAVAATFGEAPPPAAKARSQSESTSTEDESKDTSSSESKQPRNKVRSLSTSSFASDTDQAVKGPVSSHSPDEESASTIPPSSGGTAEEVVGDPQAATASAQQRDDPPTTDSGAASDHHPPSTTEDSGSDDYGRKQKASNSHGKLGQKKVTVYSSAEKKKAKRKNKRKREKRRRQRRELRKSRIENVARVLLEPNPDIPIDRQYRWATLLGSRPDMQDSDRMSAWLLEVMAVSDKKCPLRQPGISSLTSESEGEEAEKVVGEDAKSASTSTEEKDSTSTMTTTNDPSSGTDLEDEGKHEKHSRKRSHHKTAASNENVAAASEFVAKRPKPTETTSSSDDQEPSRDGSDTS
mmetsp:Transcript_116068/g.335204  ORF Transcript_116068/g.335204 Transcript_116068/m.335204 type:complete len:783 (-) Transcript_116068:12-2360(-)